jgi:predicted amidohydrolase
MSTAPLVFLLSALRRYDPPMTRIVCRQLHPSIGDLAANSELSSQAIREAVHAGADLVVLPELITSGYMLASADEARELAIPADHELFARWGQAAGTTAVVVGGFCELGADGRLYNSAAVVDASGVRAVYRKVHLWDREKLVFAPGDQPPPVLETAAGRLGVLICYDLEFPEMPRLLALAGAEIVAVPTNWPLIERPATERPPEVLIAMAAARTNRVFVACCDRTGTERGQEWTAGTAVIDHCGWVLATADPDGWASAEIQPERAADKALTDLADVLGDRRPEIYGALSRPLAARWR